MRKLFSSIVAVALLVLALNSCENFLNSNLDVREKIAEEVTISKASPVNVSVIAKAGTGEVSKSSVTAKVGVPFVVEFYAAKDEKFLNWAAFENYDDTKTLADQLGPSVIQYRKVDNQAVEGSTESKVEITIMKDVGQITLVPWCATTVNVAVIAKTGTGSVSSSAVAAKVGVPFIVEFYAEDGSEFLRWAAFENYDDTKTLDDQLGSSVIQYRKVDNSSMDGASEAKVEITIIKDVGQITLVPWCGTRPRVTTTEPVNYSTNVVRTTPIKIRFSKAIDESCIATAENPDAYKNYFELYMRRSASADEEAVDYAEYFESPVIKSSREIWFNCKAKTDESRWLPAGSIIRFVVKGSLKDADGVKFGDSTSVEFT
ncbi:MAG: Ig-like domain-containing protein, partial [Treponema sp.]|nr:Ig-like domain-containing protein [Candidatus Treponema equi]